jgi:threonine/homoserine/homoserine lactone efflux protein
MDITLLLKGFSVGFVVAIPIGPVGLLCTQRTLSHGRIHGLISGFGAATADVIYASLAVFGMTFISNFLVEEKMWFRLFGGIFLCLLGIRIFMSKQAKTGSLADKLRHFSNYTSTLLITLSNPMSILVSAAMLAGLGVAGSNIQGNSALQLVAGVFLGSMFWWITLSTSVGVFHKKAADSTLVLIARIFGGVITCLGLFVIIIAIV